MITDIPINIFWFRRDLRLDDNAGLFHALKEGKPVQCIFIFDSDILDKLEDKKDKRIVFIHQQLQLINEVLKKQGAALLTYYGKPEDVWKLLVKEFSIHAVYTNHDYEPYARFRDEKIGKLLSNYKIPFNTFKDQVIFEKSEVVKDDGSPYTVCTPFIKKWRATLTEKDFSAFPTKKYFKHFFTTEFQEIISLRKLGFTDIKTDFPPAEPVISVITNYEKFRDIPSVPGTTRMSVHLRFGTVSIRHLVGMALKVSDKWVNELIWREFYMMILWHFPHVAEHAFKKQYERLKWLPDEAAFNKWCEGKTGYPIVDAGMRELNETGFMHNRCRMITSMFLTKYLLIDWRWGEAYFAKKLLDFELASNNGGWQWSAGTGVDAAPYFRLFSMDEQTKRFDPDYIYIRKWIPEFGSPKYPAPIIDYSFARKRCLDFYKKSLG